MSLRPQLAQSSARLPLSKFAKQVLEWRPPGQRQRLQPRMTWHQTVECDPMTVKQGWYSVHRLATDNVKWNALITSYNKWHRSS